MGMAEAAENGMTTEDEGADAPPAPPELVAIDIETTGLDAARHAIIQIGWFSDRRAGSLRLGWQGRETSRSSSSWRSEPERRREWDDSAQQVHGISADQAQAWGMEPVGTAVADALRFHLGPRVRPLAHNWAFDRGFLLDLLGAEAFNAQFDYHYLDTAVLAQGLGLPHRLTELAQALELPPQADPHDAVADARLTWECYRRMVPALRASRAILLPAKKADGGVNADPRA